MRMVALVLCICTLGSSVEGSDDSDLVKMEKSILQIKSPLRLTQFLRELDLIKDWTPEADKELLVGFETSFNGISRMYRVPKKPTIVDVHFVGELDNEAANPRVSFKVTEVIIGHIEDYHVYSWINGRFKKTRTFKRADGQPPQGE